MMTLTAEPERYWIIGANANNDIWETKKKKKKKKKKKNKKSD